jgi:hypothetical protein
VIREGADQAENRIARECSHDRDVGLLFFRGVGHAIESAPKLDEVAGLDLRAAGSSSLMVCRTPPGWLA